jgi:hypothetical protein
MSDAPRKMYGVRVYGVLTGLVHDAQVEDRVRVSQVRGHLQ